MELHLRERETGRRGVAANERSRSEERGTKRTVYAALAANLLIAASNRDEYSNQPGAEASQVAETGSKSPIPLLWGPKIETPEATLDPFRTVSTGGS